MSELQRVINMQNFAKLLPVLLLGSTLSGCSLAGFGGLGSGDFGQQAQHGQYWGANSHCGNQYNAPVNTAVNPNGCQGAYPVAQSHVATQSYGGQAFAPSPYAAAQTISPAYGAQFPAAPTYVAQGQNFPAYQGQQGFQGGGFAPAFVNPQFRSSNGLRQAYTYGTLGGVLYDVDNDLYGIQGRLGWQSKSFFGAEVEGSFGISDEDDTIVLGGTPVDTDLEIDTQIAAFAVGRFPVSNRFNVLGRVGYHNTELDLELDDGTTSVSDDFSEDGIAYGVGAEYAIDRKTSVRADYTIYDFDGADADAISLAVSRKF